MQGVVALRPDWLRGRPEYVRIAVARSLEHVAMATRQRLSETWPDAEVVALAEARSAARSAHDFAEADRVRAEIAALGWDVRDADDGYELVPRA